MAIGCVAANNRGPAVTTVVSSSAVVATLANSDTARASLASGVVSTTGVVTHII